MTTPSTFQKYQAPKGLLDDKIILVTGAGDGIGRVAALYYASFGATVILLGRTLKKLEAVYDEIENQGNRQPAIFPMNFEGAAEQDIVSLHDAISEEFGRLDGILHNAAELGAQTPISNYALETWNKLLQVNITAPFMITKALLPLLSKADNASILYTSSSVGHQGKAYWGAYAVSKAAGENFVQVLADELDGSSVRVNSINPGPVRTGLRAKAYPAEDPATVALPEAVMPTYLYLMGEDSKSLNGEHINAQE
ncbi:MAG: YciK family oxidoreductase [Alteromonadaceae bacterium]|nr:MAG: YciK family oxidoreductase [Alteromonadaceae bacterium]